MTRFKTITITPLICRNAFLFSEGFVSPIRWTIRFLVGGVCNVDLSECLGFPSEVTSM